MVCLGCKNPSRPITQRNKLDDYGKTIEWNDRLEELIADDGERALCYSWLHGKAEHLYSYRNNFIALPVIVLSTLAGTASIGSDSLFQGFEFAPVIIGLTSITVGVLNTVGQYFSWAKRSEGHRIAHISYAKLYRFISTELSLPRRERMKANDLLKVVRENSDRLAETAPNIPQLIIETFQHHFTDPEISKPEIANGLEKIYIYKEMMDDAGNSIPVLKKMALDKTTNVSVTSATSVLKSILSRNSPPKHLGSPMASGTGLDALPVVENPMRKAAAVATALASKRDLKPEAVLQTVAQIPQVADAIQAIEELVEVKVDDSETKE
jgi:hypothetical protein